MTIGLLADGLLIVLLGAALGFRLSVEPAYGGIARGPRGLREADRGSRDPDQGGDRESGGLPRQCRGLGKQLDGGAERGRLVIAEVQRVSDDLRLLIGRADASSTRLEDAVAKARRDEALLGAMEERPAGTAERSQAGARCGAGSLPGSGGLPVVALGHALKER